MSGHIVHETAPITLTGGGDVPESLFRIALRYAPILYAADGGAVRALALGQQPRAVIGDLDSLPPEAPLSGAIVDAPDQETTDFQKALAWVDAPLTICTGMTGDRLDHTLAAFHVLVTHPARRIILLAGGDAACLLPAEIALSLPIGARVSLFPLAACRAGSQGLEWPLEGVWFSPFARIGTSNRASGAAQTITVDRPHMLLIVPVAHLGGLIPPLMSAPSWPAP